MTFLSFALVAYSAFTGAASVSGHVSASDGATLSGVRVFAESGLGGALLEATADPGGQFRFEGIPSGIVGIFAIAEGRGWSGVSRTIAGSDDITGLSLVLQPAGTVSGKVVDLRGKPVSGAHVTRILLQGVDKVGIPLTKLAALGFAEPVTNDSGVFSVPNLPKDGKVALKVAHIAYAQTAVQDIAVGAANAKVTLMEGILVQGTVLTWDSSSAVANTAVLFRSAVAPHDTAVAMTDSTGEFHLRLMPGVYAYQASGAELRSPGWQRVTVTGAESVQSVSVRVAGSALLRGSVQDAITGAPIEGARLSLTVYGNPSAVTTTGKSGMYEFTGSQGENVISVDAASGYRRPDRPILNVQAKQGDTLELPTFWMTRLPAFSVRVLDEAGAPVSGAVVRLIRPMQYRWYITDANGRTELQIAASPPGNKLVGLVEHVTEPRGALFAMDMNTESEAAVQLLSWARATGKVVNAKGKGLQGVVVGAIFQGDA
ncbi:MAG: carboxypeptidase-like regulatory domain-containing protein, partial [Candidatus Hydrogenedentales bacterium]